MSAESRHIKDDLWLKNKVINPVKLYLEQKYAQELEVWDEGYGQCAYRIIRPGFSDGYPPSCVCEYLILLRPMSDGKPIPGGVEHARDFFVNRHCACSRSNLVPDWTI